MGWKIGCYVVDLGTHRRILEIERRRVQLASIGMVYMYGED